MDMVGEGVDRPAVLGTEEGGFVVTPIIRHDGTQVVEETRKSRQGRPVVRRETSI